MFNWTCNCLKALTVTHANEFVKLNTPNEMNYVTLRRGIGLKFLVFIIVDTFIDVGN